MITKKDWMNRENKDLYTEDNTTEKQTTKMNRN